MLHMRTKRSGARLGGRAFPRLEALEDRAVPSATFLATDLVSDQPGVARITDPDLVNAWGIALNPNGNGAFSVSSNGKNLSTVYTGDTAGHPFAKATLEVNIPGGSPTGQVFNPTSDFAVSSRAASGPASFIFASESGAVTGWNPAVPPTTPPPSQDAQPAFQATDGAVYKGIALATNAGANFLYLADFHNNKIDVLDGSYHQVTLGTGNFSTFTDPHPIAGFAPFNIALLRGNLYVSYAKQKLPGKDDDQAGPGNGYIDVFTPAGNFVQRLVTRGVLNSPWGMTLAPGEYGNFSHALLVGNFGDGRINAYIPTTGAFLGTLSQSPGNPLVIDGLRGLAFGDNKAGYTTSLYYAAGPAGGAHGLFGRIDSFPVGTNPVSAALTGADLVITGSRNNDFVTVTPRRDGGQVVVRAGGRSIGTFDAAAVGTVRFSGFAGNDFAFVDPRVTATTILDGGAGNDRLFGGGGNVLIGGTGRDLLTGGTARDILIGGGGKDRLAGRGGDDIVIGGSTAHDGDQAALLRILSGWNAADSYNNRAAAIRAGAGGVPKLDATTVTDDGTRDDLFGNGGLDWFFTAVPDLVHDFKPAERKN